MPPRLLAAPHHPQAMRTAAAQQHTLPPVHVNIEAGAVFHASALHMMHLPCASAFMYVPLIAC